MNDSGGISVSERLAGMDAKMDRILDGQAKASDRATNLEGECRALGQRVAGLESSRDWIIRAVVGAVAFTALGAIGLKAMVP